MLEIRDLVFHTGGRPLFSGATLQVFPGQRVGLVGRNGCGKTTFFRLIRGELHPDSGSVALQAGKVLAWVEQEVADVGRPLLDYVLDGDTELRGLEAILAHTDHNEAWFDAQHRFEAIDAYSAPARAARLLAGLGFATGDAQRAVGEFSGGWRMRANLARALMKRADLLLLDEPTNHLDLEAILWLEDYLARAPGAVVLVSHDREFLNAVVNRVAHVHDGIIDDYAGDFDAFERARAERLSQQADAWRRQQDQINHLESFVNRFRAKATKARQAQSRLKALERMVRIAPVHAEDGHFGLAFASPRRCPDPLLVAKGVAIGYGERTIASGIDFALRRGSRVALLGPNGAGKSTFVKLLAGELAPSQGEFTLAPDLTVGYFAQHQLESLEPESTPLDHLEALAGDTPTLELRTFLGRFGLGGDDAQRPVATFSGGEKSRLALALLAWKRPQLLLLDEPTNHLDLDMRDALTLALEDFDGAIVLVSHDRALVRAVADELWLVADGAAKPFDGDLEDYRDWIAGRTATQAPPAVAAPIPAKAPPATKIRKKALVSKQEKLERDLSEAQERLAALEVQLADPSFYADPLSPRIAEANGERDSLHTRIAELEEAWLLLEDQMEQAS